MTTAKTHIGRRAVAAVAALGVLGAGATGCSDDSDSEKTTTVGVAAAASLTDVFTDLAKRYEAEHPGTRIRLDFGSSATLAAQLPQRSDVQLYASADTSSMDKAVAGGAAHDPVQFAANHIVLAVPAGNPGHVTSLDDLADPAKRIALCDDPVPCGKASAKVFAAAGITPAPDTKEADVRGVLTKITSGEVDAGMVYATDVASTAGKAEEAKVDARQAELERTVGATEYMLAPVGQEASEEAKGFREFLLSEIGRAALTEAGFTVPNA